MVMFERTEFTPAKCVADFALQCDGIWLTLVFRLTFRYEALRPLLYMALYQINRVIIMMYGVLPLFR